MNKRERVKTPEEALNRYPVLVSHLICESLGYFTPRSAAAAIAAHAQKSEFRCEWYIHMAGGGTKIFDVGKNTIGTAFRKRKSHSGYMAEYQRARYLVEAERRSREVPVFMSW